MSTRERRNRSDASDASLVGLFNAIGKTSQGVSLAAVGGYGRGELSPGSDLDLLFLHKGKNQSDLNEIVNSVLYPLWDQGLSIDHSVRTRKDNIININFNRILILIHLIQINHRRKRSKNLRNLNKSLMSSK